MPFKIQRRLQRENTGVDTMPPYHDQTEGLWSANITGECNFTWQKGVHWSALEKYKMKNFMPELWTKRSSHGVKAWITHEVGSWVGKAMLHI